MPSACWEGHIRKGNFTYQKSFTARSVCLSAAAAGFSWALTCSSPPVAHKPTSAAHVIAWQAVGAPATGSL
jgi:hypothetical protein